VSSNLSSESAARHNSQTSLAPTSVPVNNPAFDLPALTVSEQNNSGGTPKQLRYFSMTGKILEIDGMKRKGVDQEVFLVSGESSKPGQLVSPCSSTKLHSNPVNNVGNRTENPDEKSKGEKEDQRLNLALSTNFFPENKESLKQGKEEKKLSANKVSEKINDENAKNGQNKRSLTESKLTEMNGKFLENKRNNERHSSSLYKTKKLSSRSEKMEGMKAAPLSTGLSVSRLESKEESKDELSKFGTSPKKKVLPSPYAATIEPRKDGIDTETRMSPIEVSSDGIDIEIGDVNKREERTLRFHPPTNCPRSEAKGRWEGTFAKVRDSKGENNQEQQIKTKKNREEQFQNKNFKKKHMIRGAVKFFPGQFWDHDESTEWPGKKVEEAMSDKRDGHGAKVEDQICLTEKEAREWDKRDGRGGKGEDEIRLTEKEGSSSLTEKEAREWRTRWREVAAISKKKP